VVVKVVEASFLVEDLSIAFDLASGSACDYLE
jgi:hypothetical protein